MAGARDTLLVVGNKDDVLPVRQLVFRSHVEGEGRFTGTQVSSSTGTDVAADGVPSRASLATPRRGWSQLLLKR